MGTLAEKVLASKKVFFIYLASFYALWMSNHILDQYASSLSKQIFSEHLIDKVRFFDSLNFVLNISQFLFVIQFLILVVGLGFNLQKATEKSNRSILVETISISLTFLNSTLILFLILSGTFIFNPGKATVFISLIFVFIAALTISYSINSDRNETEMTNEFSKKSIWTKLQNFGFPHFREIFVISWAFAFLCGMLQLGKIIPLNSFLSWIIIKLLPFLIVVAGIIYFLLGFIFQIKNLDELQRHIFYEQSFIITLILIGVLLGYITIFPFFHITFEFLDLGIIFAPAVLISRLFVKEKYQ